MNLMKSSLQNQQFDGECGSFNKYRPGFSFAAHPAAPLPQAPLDGAAVAVATGDALRVEA
jgi:hypothetical protein